MVVTVLVATVLVALPAAPTQAQTNRANRANVMVDGAFTDGVLGGHGSRGTRASMLVVEEPAACGLPANDVDQYGPIMHAYGLATYRVRLSKNPGGSAKLTVFGPRGLLWGYDPDYRFGATHVGADPYKGGLTVRAPEEDTTYVERWPHAPFGALQLSFNRDNWNQWQTVSLNIHCANHKDHYAYRFQHKLTLPGDIGWVDSQTVAGEVDRKDRSSWHDVRVKVIDTKSPQQPAILTAVSAYAGTLNVSHGQGASIHCTDGDCEWSFNVKYNWHTTATSNDWVDATKHFSQFRVRLEGDTSLSPRIPIRVNRQRPDFIIDKDPDHLGSRRTNTQPYYAGFPNTGLKHSLTTASSVNPGDPIYRIKITPVTIRNVEVPGESVTICIQLLSTTTSQKFKKSVVVDCSGFTLGSSGVIKLQQVEQQTIETPEVNITGAVGGTEGDPVSFTVTANPAPAADLPVSITVATDGDFGYGALPSSVTIPTSGSATVTVTTTDDSTDEADGSVTLTLNAGEGYTVGALSSETASVADDDPTVQQQQTPDYTDYQTVVDYLIQVRDNPENTAVQDNPAHIAKWNKVLSAIGHSTAEDPMAASVIHANAAKWPDSPFKAASDYLNRPLDQGQQQTPDYQTVVDYLIQVRDNPVNTAVQGNPAHIAKWNKVLSAIGYTTSEEAMAESVIHANAAAWPDSPFKAASDYLNRPLDQGQQQTPVVSVTGAVGGTEGDPVSFTVTANPAPAADLPVSITVATVGDFGYGALPVSVTIPTGGSATVTVTTTDDSTDEADGSVTLTLNAGEGYTVGSLSSETASVTDDDPTVQQQQQQTPEVSVTGGSAITEGGDATFTVSASPAPPADLDVSVTVSQSGDYGATTGQQTVTIPTTGSVTLNVGTTDDSADETDGSVTATVDTGNGYTVSSSQGAATVSVADNDDATPPPPPPPDTDGAVLGDCGGTAPSLSISNPTADRDDAVADFEVSVDCKPASDVVILFQPVRDNTPGSYILIILAGDDPTATVTVPVRGARQLSLAIGWSTGLANPQTQGQVIYTN